MNLHTMKLKLFSFFSESRSIYFIQPLFNACFYSIKAVFIFYAVQRLSLAEGEAIALFATFMTLCYATSLLGGYIADKWLGVKDTVTLGGALMVLGLLCILFPSQDLCFLGLALAALGSGCFKPNLLAAVGLIFNDPKDPRKDKAYSIIYTGMNLGTLIFPILCGFVGEIYGWNYGIIFIAVVFTAATILYYATMRFHVPGTEKIIYSPSKLFGMLLFLIVFLYILFKYRESFHGIMGVIVCGSIVYFGRIFFQCNAQERKGILSISAYLLLFVIFFILGEQSGSSLMLFYEKALDREVMGFLLPATTFFSLGSFFVLILGPLLIFLSGRYLEKTKPMDGFFKMGYGFLWLAFSFWIFAYAIPFDAPLVSPLWIALAIFVHTLGELWIVPIGISQISQHSPQRFQSVMMSFWTMTIAYGHYVGGFVAQFSVTATPVNSLQHYRAFFQYVGWIPLLIGLTMLLCRIIGRYVSKTAEKRTL
jgi:POT family proton-dependent oligopeptide transporter